MFQYLSGVGFKLSAILHTQLFAPLKYDNIQTPPHNTIKVPQRYVVQEGDATMIPRVASSPGQQILSK